MGGGERGGPRFRTSAVVCRRKIVPHSTFIRVEYFRLSEHFCGGAVQRIT